MGTTNDERLECFAQLFGAYYAKQLNKGGYQQLWDACNAPDDPLMRDMAPRQRQQLRAVLRLCQLYYREQNWAPQHIETTADVVRLIRPRTRDQAERIVWLLALDGSNCLQHEVLVQMGGPATTPPLVNALVRHALFKTADQIYVVDFQIVDDIVVSDERRAWFEQLDAGCALIGVALVDVVLLTPNVVTPLREAIAATVQHEEVREAA